MPVAKLGVRASGLLLHPTSLPGPHGNGDLGSEAAAFVEFLCAAEQSFWQMLPIGPCGYGNSPYSAQSAFAGNPLLIALGPLVRAGYLPDEVLARAPAFSDERVDYVAADAFRTHCLRQAFERAGSPARLRDFCEQQREWLDDYALFRALKSAHRDVQWTRWEPAYRDREPAALAGATREFADEIAFRRFEQWLFSEQWRELRALCAARGIALIGDIPIFLAHDSADVWQQRELFQLDALGLPTVVSGVPPDYFSTTGQRWGNPLYHWARIERSGYKFWIDRMRSMHERFDVVRLDHFIGFQRYWEIPASEATAEHGRWMRGPRAALFEALTQALGPLPLIAEDLGEVTPDVIALRDQLGLPGLKILQFAFGDDPSAEAFLPHNYPRRAVVYTGTHDNDTTRGWFFAHAHANESDPRSSTQIDQECRAALAYLGVANGNEIHWDMIRMAMLSVAETAIFPLQDVLGLGSEARMNQPGAAIGNWQWRCKPGATSAPLAQRLAALTRCYQRGRAAPTR